MWYMVNNQYMLPFITNDPSLFGWYVTFILSFNSHDSPMEQTIPALFRDVELRLKEVKPFSHNHSCQWYSWDSSSDSRICNTNCLIISVLHSRYEHCCSSTVYIFTNLIVFLLIHPYIHRYIGLWYVIFLYLFIINVIL